MLWRVYTFTLVFCKAETYVGCFDDSQEKVSMDWQKGVSLGDVLLQAKTYGFKALAPQVKSMHVPPDDASAKQDSDAHDPPKHTSTSNRASSKERSAFETKPRLKEPAWHADENYKHDQQPDLKKIEQLDHDRARGPRSLRQAMHLAVSIMLLGFIGLVMVLFYLVNWPDEDIREATWRLLSTTISIFLAVLIFSAFQDAMAFFAHRFFPAHEPYSEQVDSEDNARVESCDDALLGSFARYLILCVILQMVLFFVDRSSGLIKAFAQLGSHIVAFAGVDAFALLQESRHISHDSFYDNLQALAVSTMIVWGVFDLAELVRWRLVRHNLTGDSPLDHARQLWYHECRLGEHEAAGVILGLLLSQNIRGAITGQYPSLHTGAPTQKSNKQVWTLFGIALLLGALVVPIEWGLQRLTEGLHDISDQILSGRINWKLWSTRLIRICRETLSMTMAWCFLYWGQWEFWYMTQDLMLGWGSTMSAMLGIALLLSAVCFSGIFVIDFIADRLENRKSHQAGFVALGNGFGLIMGLGWETCFREAVAGVSRIPNRFDLSEVLSNMALIAILCIVVLPAWVLFIHPNALVNRREEMLHHEHSIHFGNSGHGND